MSRNSSWIYHDSNWYASRKEWSDSPCGRYQGSRDCCSAKDNPQHCGFCSLKGWGKDRLGNPRSDDGGQHFILVKIYRAIVRSMKKKMILKIQFALITSSRRKRPTPNTTVPVWAKKWKNTACLDDNLPTGQNLWGNDNVERDICHIWGGDRWRTSRNCRCRRRGRPIIPPVAGSGSWLSSSLPLLASCWGGEIFAVDSHYSGMPEDFCFIRYLVAEIQTAQIRLKCKPFIYTGMTEILPIWKSRALKQIPESAGRMLTFSSKNSKKRKGDQTEAYIYSIYN